MGDGRRLTIGAYCGASRCHARLRDGESADDLLRRVDAKLYEAKANGRNRVVVDASDRFASETTS